MSPRVIRHVSELGQSLASAPVMPLPTRVLMIRPTAFNIEVAINVHMCDAEGRPHALDKDLALRQWEALRRTYERLGFAVLVLEGTDGLPDMTFAANQTLPYVDPEGKRRALLSNMADDVRHREVEDVAAFLEDLGYAPAPLLPRTPDTLFEGMGDALWIPGRRFLVGGHGFRTRLTVYETVATRTGTSVAALELKNPKFYHLDTCLAVLNADTAIACLEAFTPEGQDLIRALFPRLIAVPLAEADAPGFACNAHCPDGRHVIIQEGCDATEKALTASGFVPVPVNTSEFIKSGGSVFCLKMMLY